MNITRETVYLSALLRGVGKLLFYLEEAEASPGLCEDIYTRQFIESHEDAFRTLFHDEKGYQDFVETSVAYGCGNGERRKLADYVLEGESLSVGKLKSNPYGDYSPNARLVSIMNSVGDSSISVIFRSLDKLKLDDGLFPIADALEKDRAGLTDSFNADFGKIKASDILTFSETLLSLLQVYASTIPAYGRESCDISLYDQIRTSAAISVCLYDCDMSEGNPNEPFLLVGADFSGIQSYIYQIVSKYAGKNLKGRSYYIRLLSDTAVRYISKALNLHSANVIYNSGGGFYLLAPNVKSVKLALENASDKIESSMFSLHGASLFLAIDSTAFSKDVLLHKGETLSDVWGRLFVKRDKRKQTKWKGMLSNSYETFFSPDNRVDYSSVDAITGEPFLEGDKKVPFEGKYIREITRQQIKLGEVLRNFYAVIVSDVEVEPLKGCFHIEPLSMGIHYYYVTKTDLLGNKSDIDSYGHRITICLYNGEGGDCDSLFEISSKNILQLSFYGGNEQARNRMATFEEMCEGVGLRRLGVLRMDVDNLGSIFQGGLKPETATLSHYAALSRSFDIFFSGYINTVWSELHPSKSYILYSGGDDLFIVGSWDVIIEFAERIRNDFRRYACGNPRFSISGGISIVPPKFPLMKAADLSAEEESNAKSHKAGEYSKNSISILSCPLNWDFEYPAVKSLAKRIVDGVTYEMIPKSFISKVLQALSNAVFVNHRPTNMKIYWMLSYDLSRMKRRRRESNELVDNCLADVCNNKGRLYGEEITTSYHPLELWALACRWAELELRTKGLLN